MEAILNDRSIQGRLRSRSIVPVRDYTHTYIREEHRRDITNKVVKEESSQPIAQTHQFSRVTPIYVSIPNNSNSQRHRSHTVTIDSIKSPKKILPKRTQRYTDHINMGSVQCLDEIALLEVSLDMVDLDLTGGMLKLNESDFTQQYFDNTSDVSDIVDDTEKSVHRTPSPKNMRSKYISRLGAIVLLIAAIIVWSSVFGDSLFVDKQANATVLHPTTPEQAPIVADAHAYEPKYVTIPKLSIHASVDSVNVTPTGAMDVPTDIWRAGWYVKSALPGHKGATFIDGHASSSRGALFGNLDTLVIGDQIDIERNDGIVVKYRVAKTAIVNRNDVDMTSMLRPYSDTKNGLNIMSCVGQWIDTENTLENRVLVYAVQL